MKKILLSLLTATILVGCAVQPVPNTIESEDQVIEVPANKKVTITIVIE